MPRTTPTCPPRGCACSWSEPARRTSSFLRDSLGTTTLDHVDSVEEAKRRLQGAPYDAVLLQCEPGDALAAGLTRELNISGLTAPLLFLSDCADEVSVEQIMRAGACECVNRSGLDSRSVLRALRNALSFHRAQQQTREAQEMLRTLSRAVEQSADVVVITDREGVIEYVDPAFEKLTGSRSEAVGQPPAF